MVQASRRKFHYIYKITRIDTGKYYIGMHSSDNLEDGYFGSGKLITASIKKHGKDAHLKEILEFCDSRELLKAREKELVNRDLLEDKRCMNLVVGGDGGWNLTANQLTANGRLGAARCIELGKNWMFDPEKRKKALEVKKMNGNTCNWLGRKHSDVTKEKQRLLAIGKQTGTKNSQFDTQWIYNVVLKQNKRISKFEDIPDGWHRGRKINF